MCVRAQDTFEYERNAVDYIVNQAIESNTPQTKEKGKYSITPSLSKGLKIDESTGIISGTPEEEYQSDFTVKLTREDGSYLLATINIKSIILLIYFHSLGKSKYYNLWS